MAMKIKSLVSVIASLVASVLLIACGAKKDPSEEAFETLFQSVPADVSFFAGGYITMADQAKNQETGNWKKVVDALQSNPAISEKFEKLLDASPDAKYFFQRWLGGSDFLTALSDACAVAPAPMAFVAYMDGDLDCTKKDLAFSFAATMGKEYVASAERFIECCVHEQERTGRGEGRWKKEIVGEKKVFVYTEGKAVIAVAFCGNDMLVASSRERLDALEASFRNPTGASLKDSAVFEKAAAGVKKYNLVALLNFDEFKDFRTAKADADFVEKLFRETAESLSFFVDIPFAEKTSDTLLRVEFSRPLCIHDALSSMAKKKPQTLKNALPGADYALGIALPDLSDELCKDMNVPAAHAEKIRRLDPKMLYLSVADSERIAGLVSGDTTSFPQAFVKLECADNSVLKEEEGLAPIFQMAQKQEIDGVDVYSSIFFGIKYALLGRTDVYISNLFDASAALNLARGKGKSLADDGMFNGVAGRIAGENAAEAFVNDRASTQLQLEMSRTVIAKEGLSVTEDVESTLAFYELFLTLVKKSIYGSALRRNGTAIELHLAYECEYDFDALAEAIKKLK